MFLAGIALTGTVSSQPVDAAPASLTRPADLETWPTLGTTLRMSAENPEQGWQMRHVQMAPAALRSFIASGQYPDGATFSATLYGVALETTHTPNFYHAEQEAALVMEVIDRAHPDGRRFYVFAPGVTMATALPAGNECAVCHAARGSFDGTFGDFYPTIARHRAASN